MGSAFGLVGLKRITYLNCF